MKRGFEAVLADLDALAAKPLPDALKAIGTKLVMTVGGASGPLFGTLFMTLGKELAGRARPRRRSPRRSPGAVDAVAARGKSEAGQKTMLDVLCPGAGGARRRQAGRRDRRDRAHAAAAATDADEGDRAAAPRSSATARSATSIPARAPAR